MFGIDDALMIPLIGSLVTSVGGTLLGNAGAKARIDQMNAYNTPAAQMQRYAAAGLNPNLIYGQGSAGNQSSAAQFMTPDIDPVKIYSAAQAIRESRLRAELHSARKSAQQMLSQYMIAKYNADEPYFARNAKFQSSILEQRFKNDLMNWRLGSQRYGTESKKQGLLDLDAKIREQIHEKQRYELGSLRAIDPTKRGYFDLLLRALQTVKP